ncbi:DoxX family protein [Fibrella sp. HMF5335]|uniref:DoxX family protein n=1 Tax=Fibrella rubiginis TaxID=2817060 RepID=A0A939K4W3_9BACT|nr:DoxX family protein [Fibrella rubiginis]MBO0936626.1 DoxX family protein [Fibrella rubiginis]
MNATLIIFYIALLVISLVYLVAGFQKVSGREPMKSRMAEMNQGGVVMLLIGMAEIAGVIGIWLPATRPLALLCLMPFSIGGITAHIVLRHNFRERNIPAVLMIVLICVAFWLDPSFSIVFN